MKVGDRVKYVGEGEAGEPGTICKTFGHHGEDLYLVFWDNTWTSEIDEDYLVEVDLLSVHSEVELEAIL